MSKKNKMPFEYQNKEDFLDKLVDWIGHVFYDVFPEKDYEVREEQVYTAFQIADAVCKNEVHFAEAGLGTGKTFAYLLSAVAYARFKRKPVVIACASTALAEQLAGSIGDINTLSRLLDLNIDARVAKDPDQYLCDIKVDRLRYTQKPSEALDKIFQWTEKTTRGERSEIPKVPDKIWRRLGWDESMNCEGCSKRGYCKLVRAREYYRGAQDLIIADHKIFFDDLWTREELLEDRKLPLLPDYSAVIFDEGHKIMLPAFMSAGKEIKEKDIETIIHTFEKAQGVRTSLVSSIYAVELATEKFFKKLQKSLVSDEISDRLAVRTDDDLFDSANVLKRALDILENEIQNEEELHAGLVSDNTLNLYDLKLERAIDALYRFCKNKGNDTIVWVDKNDKTFWVVPKELPRLLNKHLFSKKMPVVFSSATLSSGGNFDYMSKTLGLKSPSAASVGSSFDYEEQVSLKVYDDLKINDPKKLFDLKIKRLVSLLLNNKGRALVLTNSVAEIKKIREELGKYDLPFEVFWEDKAERGYLIRKFRTEVSSSLVGSSFWEGLDVPGESLSLLIIWDLPFPSIDPLIEARRQKAIKEGENPLYVVDYPEMSLKLKQGCGRLIRTKDDKGIIAILEQVEDMPFADFVWRSLPEGVK